MGMIVPSTDLSTINYGVTYKNDLTGVSSTVNNIAQRYISFTNGLFAGGMGNIDTGAYEQSAYSFLGLMLSQLYNRPASVVSFGSSPATGSVVSQNVSAVPSADPAANSKSTELEAAKAKADRYRLKYDDDTTLDELSKKIVEYEKAHQATVAKSKEVDQYKDCQAVKDIKALIVPLQNQLDEEAAKGASANLLKSNDLREKITVYKDQIKELETGKKAQQKEKELVTFVQDLVACMNLYDPKAPKSSNASFVPKSVLLKQLNNDKDKLSVIIADLDKYENYHSDLVKTAIDEVNRRLTEMASNGYSPAPTVDPVKQQKTDDKAAADKAKQVEKTTKQVNDFLSKLEKNLAAYKAENENKWGIVRWVDGSKSIIDIKNDREKVKALMTQLGSSATSEMNKKLEAIDAQIAAIKKPQPAVEKAPTTDKGKKEQAIINKINEITTCMEKIDGRNMKDKTPEIQVKMAELNSLLFNFKCAYTTTDKMDTTIKVLNEKLAAKGIK